MPARSIARQILTIAKETTPGTPATTGFKQVQALKATIGHSIEGKDFKASGSKVNTARVADTEMADVSLDTIMDFNGILWGATGGFGAPTSVAGTGPTAGTTAHTYLLNPYAADPKQTFTGIYGDGSQAIRIAHLIFQTFGFTVQRGSLEFNTSAMGYFPETGIALPTPITQVPTKTAAGRQFDAFLDATWAALGTTKLLAAYEGSCDFGEKNAPDWTINSAVPSFTETIEAEDTDYTGTLRVGFDSVAIALINTFKAGDLRFLRLKATGPIAALAIPHSITLDLCIRITEVGEYSAAPNSPAISLPFTFNVAVDDLGNCAKLVVVNTLDGL